MSAKPDFDLSPPTDADATLDQFQQGVGWKVEEKREYKMRRDPHLANEPGDQLAELLRIEGKFREVQALEDLLFDRSKDTSNFVEQVASEFNSLQNAIEQFVIFKNRADSNQLVPHDSPDLLGISFGSEDWVNFRQILRSAVNIFLKTDEELSGKQSEQFHTSVVEFDTRTKHCKPNAAEFEQAQPSSISQDLSSLLASYVDHYMARVVATMPVGNLSPNMDQSVRRALLPANATNPVFQMPEVMTDEGIMEVMRASADAWMKRSGEGAKLTEIMDSTQFVETASLRYQDGTTISKHLPEVLKEVATIIRKGGESRGSTNFDWNSTTDACVQDFAFKTLSDLLEQVIEYHQESHASNQGLPITQEMSSQSELVNSFAKLEDLREQATVERAYQDRFEVKRPSSLGEDAAAPFITNRAYKQIRSYKRESASVQRDDSPQSAPYTSGTAFQIFDYEIRRILEQQNQPNVSADKVGCSRPLAAPLPTPRTRM